MKTSSYKEVFEKIRVDFLFNHPFLSVLALSLPSFIQENKSGAFLTDGFNIKIDEEKLSTYSFNELTYQYAHTLLHIVLKHPQRKKQRELKTWNRACDIVINLILDEFENIGQKPKDEILELEYKNLSVEEVYEKIFKEEEEKKKSEGKSEDEQKQDIESKSLNDGGDENFDEELDNIIVQALSLARKSSKIPQGFLIEIDEIIKPDIDLSSILKEYMIESSFEKKLSFKRPNKKFICHNLYMPGFESQVEKIDIFIALDCSSSVSLNEYKKFLGIIESICEGFYEYKITVLPFDTSVRSEHILEFDSFTSLENKEINIPKSNGGTNFDSVIEYISMSLEFEPNSLLIVLSDGEFEFDLPLPFQTLFVISDRKNLTRFENYGRVIQFRV